MTKQAKQRPGLLGLDNKWPFLVTMGLLLLLAALALYFNIARDVAVTVLAGGSDPRISLADLETGELQFFDYPLTAATRARFVVQRGEDDTIRVSFASCPLCYASGRPSREWRGQLICGHCNHRMRLPNPDEAPPEKKGCIPVAIPYVIEGKTLVIHQEAIGDLLAKWYTRKEKR